MREGVYNRGMEKFLKWLSVTAFGFLLFGGMNWLFMGLFNVDIFETIFGTSTVARVLYSIFGLAALTLFIIILAKAFMSKTETKKIEHKVEAVIDAVKGGSRGGTPRAKSAPKSAH